MVRVCKKARKGKAGGGKMIEASQAALKYVRTESKNQFMGGDMEYAQAEFLRHAQTYS